jgi:glycine/D-amino acid oxidase-like deaminating enzyme/nitrite reductase/ring-hydroxylating ferredoxin subunit
MTSSTIANDSGATLSTWMSERVSAFDSPIVDDGVADVCVIGAGIAGLSVALALVHDGLDVLVLDQGPIGGGQTARTSAHLASAVDDDFHLLEKRFGREGASLVYQSHAAAIDWIQSNIERYGIDCEFRRVDAYLWTPPNGDPDFQSKELAACRRAGLLVDVVPRAPLPFDTGPCMRFGNQAEFHPLKYLRGIADAIVAGGGRIHTGVHVNGVKSGDPVEVELADGRTLRARALVDCTQMAITSRFNMPLREAAYRTYMIAVDIAPGYVPHGLYWDALDPYHYVRVAAADGGREVLLVGGEDHRVGQGDPEACFPRLESWVREHFPAAGRVVRTWSGQIQEPSDGLAYIGKLPLHANVYVCTGDSGNGLTHGTIAGLLIPALIQHREHPWRKLYSPSRSRLRAVRELAKELAHSNGPYTDWVRGGDVDSIEQIAPGHGATIRRGLHLVAAYKDEQGQCHLMNAHCPHFHGVVRWNEVERTWDCPVHGSRFDCNGRVLNGPSPMNLAAAPADVDVKALPESARASTGVTASEERPPTHRR